MAKNTEETLEMHDEDLTPLQPLPQRKKKKGNKGFFFLILLMIIGSYYAYNHVEALAQVASSLVTKWSTPEVTATDPEKKVSFHCNIWQEKILKPPAELTMVQELTMDSSYTVTMEKKATQVEIVFRNEYNNDLYSCVAKGSTPKNHPVNVALQCDTWMGSRVLSRSGEPSVLVNQKIRAMYEPYMVPTIRIGYGSSIDLQIAGRGQVGLHCNIVPL